MDETLVAAKELVKDGFEVMVYCTDDPILTKKLAKSENENISLQYLKETAKTKSIFILIGSLPIKLQNKLVKARPIKVIPRYSDIFKPGIDVRFLKNTNIASYPG